MAVRNLKRICGKMKEPKIKKDKLSNGWYVDWYGIKIFFYPSYKEAVTEEYSCPSVWVTNKSRYSDENMVDFFIEGEE